MCVAVVGVVPTLVRPLPFRCPFRYSGLLFYEQGDVAVVVVTDSDDEIVVGAGSVPSQWALCFVGTGSVKTGDNAERMMPRARWTQKVSFCTCRVFSARVEKGSDFVCRFSVGLREPSSEQTPTHTQKRTHAHMHANSLVRLVVGIFSMHFPKFFSPSHSPRPSHDRLGEQKPQIGFVEMLSVHSSCHKMKTSLLKLIP